MSSGGRGSVTAAVQFKFDTGKDHLDPDPVVASLGEDDVGVALRRFDELEVHRSHRRKVLPDHVVHGPAPVSDVSLQSPNETDVLGDIDKDLDVEERSDAWIGEKQDPVDNDDLPRFDLHGGFSTCVRRVVIGRFLDDLAACQLFEVPNQKFGVEGIRMVEVDPATFIEAEVPKVGIVGVLINERRIDSQELVDSAGHSGLAGARPSHHTNHQWSFEHAPAGWDADSMNRIVTVGNPETGEV